MIDEMMRETLENLSELSPEQRKKVLSGLGLSLTARKNIESLLKLLPLDDDPEMGTGCGVLRPS
ncbi:hypothetical protein KKF55_05860 [Patescibacteria group bacterium]|nr:hypothetical protein [Patescibacteria group bacterium]